MLRFNPVNGEWYDSADVISPQFSTPSNVLDANGVKRSELVNSIPTDSLKTYNTNTEEYISNYFGITGSVINTIYNNATIFNFATTPLISAEKNNNGILIFSASFCLRIKNFTYTSPLQTLCGFRLDKPDPYSVPPVTLPQPLIPLQNKYIIAGSKQSSSDEDIIRMFQGEGANIWLPPKTPLYLDISSGAFLDVTYYVRFKRYETI